MAVKQPHIYEPGVYFITFTNYSWLHLFAITHSYDLIYNWFDHLKSRNHYIVGSVIMPNHIHALLAYNYSKQSLNTIIGNGKRFMAYEIIDRLKAKSRVDILNILTAGVSIQDKKKGQLHTVFEPSFDAKLCLDYKFINQKLSYIHNNPVNKKWVLATDSISYPHSSANFYETGIHKSYEVVHYMELIDKDWIER